MSVLERLWNGACDPQSYSPLALAFVGDCVYELFVRERLACAGNCPAGKLHSRSVENVRCSAQAAAVERILPLLTEEEAAVLRRGEMRTLATNRVMPKRRITGWRPRWKRYSAICI